MAVHKISVNIREMADLQAVVSYYEQNVSAQTGGRSTIAAAWRPIEQVKATFESSYRSLSPADTLRKSWNEAKEGIQTVNNLYNEEVTNKINNALGEIAKAGQNAKRDASVNVGPFHIKTQNTIAAMANAKTPGEAAAILVADCIPCQWRLDAVQLLPDISFLDELIKQAEDWINMLGGLVETFLGLGVDGEGSSPQANLCITLNLFNFTCLPDMSALAAMLAKSLSLSITLPSFQLSPISSLSAMIVAPILATCVNLMQAWLNLILKPIDCILESLTTLTRRFQFQGKTLANLQAGVSITGGSFTVGKTKVSSGVNVNKKSGLPSGASKFLSNLDNTKQIEAVNKSFEQIKKFIEHHKNKVLAQFEKMRGKSRSLLNEMTRFVQSLVASSKEILKIVNMLALIMVLKDLFQQFSAQCPTKEEATAAVADVAPAAVGQTIPGVQVIRQVARAAAIQRTVDLTKEEAAALRLNELPGVSFEDGQGAVINNVVSREGEGEQGQVRAVVRDTISLKDCFVAATRSSFYDVSRWLES